MKHHNSPRVAVIGLGAMGLPMARHLATTFAVIGFEPYEPRRGQAEQAGITAESTPAAACAQADIALLAVRDHAQAEAALFGQDGVIETLRPGAPVILTSTVGPDAARDLAERLAAAQHPLVDAPISGGPVRAGNGDLLIVLGTDDTTLDTVRPVLDHLASTLTVVGSRPGDGQALKAINQLLAGVHIAAAAEAVALARGVGLDLVWTRRWSSTRCRRAPQALSCSPIAAPACCRRTPVGPRSNPESTSSSKTWGS
jgi:3-hydroxyisobutyrate dehydrogenase